MLMQQPLVKPITTNHFVYGTIHARGTFVAVGELFVRIFKPFRVPLHLVRIFNVALCAIQDPKPSQYEPKETGNLNQFTQSFSKQLVLRT